MSRETRRRVVPEFFCTTTRKVEPVGGGVVRVYCSIERDGEWQDQCTILMPIELIMNNAKFVTQSAIEIFEESEALTSRSQHH